LQGEIRQLRVEVKQLRQALAEIGLAACTDLASLVETNPLSGEPEPRREGQSILPGGRAIVTEYLKTGTSLRAPSAAHRAANAGGPPRGRAGQG
jgi:hypothetical protein